MQRFFKRFTGMVAIAALGAAFIAATPQIALAQAQTPPKKNLKDQGEFDIYNEVIKDVTANNFTKAVTDLDTWSQKYPDSEYKDERSVFYIQAYNGANQPGKVLDTAAPLLARDYKASLEARNVLTVLYATALSAAKITAPEGTSKPTADQLATGEKASNALVDYAKEYFAADKKPANIGDADWTKARSDVETIAKAALLSISVFPGNQAMQQCQSAKNQQQCATAEAVFSKVLQTHQDSAQLAYLLAGALRAQQASDPNKVPQAIYMYARASALDPAHGGFPEAQRAQIEKYFSQVYTAYHGSDEGMAQLKEMALKSPLPPGGFKIETAAEIATRKENEFKEKYPQLAMWMGIKRQLTEPAGDQYFENTLKNAAVPTLKGTVIEGKPACRSKELLVAIPEPNQQGTLQAEITLKLDAPLTGKPEAGEIQWEGVPSAFTREPLMLTMDTEKAKIENLKVTPCAPAAAPRPSVKKTPPKKK